MRPAPREQIADVGAALDAVRTAGRAFSEQHQRTSSTERAFSEQHQQTSSTRRAFAKHHQKDLGEAYPS